MITIFYYVRSRKIPWGWILFYLQYVFRDLSLLRLIIFLVSRLSLSYSILSFSFCDNKYLPCARFLCNNLASIWLLRHFGLSICVRGRLLQTEMHILTVPFKIS